jgi:hypothetical protein
MAIASALFTATSVAFLAVEALLSAFFTASIHSCKRRERQILVRVEVVEDYLWQLLLLIVVGVVDVNHIMSNLYSL